MFSHNAAGSSSFLEIECHAQNGNNSAIVLKNGPSLFPRLFIGAHTINEATTHKVRISSQVWLNNVSKDDPMDDLTNLVTTHECFFFLFKTGFQNPSVARLSKADDESRRCADFLKDNGYYRQQSGGVRDVLQTQTCEKKTKPDS
eukprot:scaffold4049_cov76-Cylindrotheca_fusiformis.AAC.8